ncbi:MAG: purine-nucleoside phosphorylase [Vicinamibacteria bacterium]|nr:purine-nucleoside phosphorylase [Vicinamibacteria bacterium]
MEATERNEANRPSRQADEAAAAIRARIGAPFAPKVGVVLGSGLAAFGNAVPNATRIPYSEIPHFLRPTAEGHKGELVLGEVSGVPVAVMSGRVHFYEGHTVHQVVYPVRVLGRLGVSTVILTNAAGAVNKSYRPGDFMALTDHLNLTGKNPLIGPNDPALGPRFPDMSTPYDRALRAKAVGAFRKVGATIHEGVYVGLLGPSYETPAEIAMFRMLGADAVGMSTVLETIAARHMGLQVIGISCITNAASDHGETLSHESVLEESKKAEGKFVAALQATLESMR